MQISGTDIIIFPIITIITPPDCAKLIKGASSSFNPKGKKHQFQSSHTEETHNLLTGEQRDRCLSHFTHKAWCLCNCTLDLVKYKRSTCNSQREYNRSYNVYIFVNILYS